jgi:hypothetical protein
LKREAVGALKRRDWRDRITSQITIQSLLLYHAATYRDACFFLQESATVPNRGFIRKYCKVFVQENMLFLNDARLFRVTTKRQVENSSSDLIVKQREGILKFLFSAGSEE